MDSNTALPRVSYTEMPFVNEESEYPLPISGWMQEVVGETKIKRKRAVNETADEVNKRRRIRKLKNKESAARSRARKQAYILDLEVERGRLIEENTRIQQKRRLVERLTEELCKDEEVEEEEKAQILNQILRRCRSCIW